MVDEIDRPMTAGHESGDAGWPTEEPLPAEDDWPGAETTTTETGEWVKSCGCPGGENEHSLTCGEVQRYL